MERVPPIDGRLGIPTALEDLLPWWLRYRNGLFVNPLGVASAVALYLGYPLVAGVGLALTLVLHVSSFWVAKAWLTRNRYWVHGTWDAEALTKIHALRAIFAGSILFSAGGAYLALAANLRSMALTIATVAALALIVPLYIWVSVLQGFVGGSFGVDYREKQPARFWMGLFTYSLAFGVVVTVAGFFVIDKYFGLLVHG